MLRKNKIIRITEKTWVWHRPPDPHAPSQMARVRHKFITYNIRLRTHFILTVAPKPTLFRYSHKPRTPQFNFSRYTVILVNQWRLFSAMFMPGFLTEDPLHLAPPQSRGGWWRWGRRLSTRISVRLKTKWWIQWLSLSSPNPSLPIAGFRSEYFYFYLFYVIFICSWIYHVAIIMW